MQAGGTLLHVGFSVGGLARQAQLLALTMSSPGLPLGLEAPVMTPNGVNFLFFSLTMSMKGKLLFETMQQK